jgi:hypothetical protein
MGLGGPMDHGFSCQIARLRIVAKATQTAKGTRHHAAKWSRRRRTMMVARMSASCGTMFKRPSAGLCAAKNIQDQAAFSVSWAKKKFRPQRRAGGFRADRKTRQTATAISRYSVVQAGGNTQFGGVEWGFYQPGIPGREVGVSGKLADERGGSNRDHGEREQTRLADHGGFVSSRIQLIPDGPTGLFLPHCGTIDRITARCNVLDPTSDGITAPQLAVDCEIEHCQRPRSACDPKASSNAQPLRLGTLTS